MRWQDKSGWLWAIQPCTQTIIGGKNRGICMRYQYNQVEKDVLRIMLRNWYFSFLSNMWNFQLPSDLGNRHVKTILNELWLRICKFFSKEEVFCVGRMWQPQSSKGKAHKLKITPWITDRLKVSTNGSLSYNKNKND